MGIFGKKPAIASTVLTVEELRTRLLALNRPTAPYQIRDGTPEGVDLVAEWKIVDAQWYEIFAKAKLTKVFRIYMKFDPAKHELRAQDHEYTVAWQAGVTGVGSPGPASPNGSSAATLTPGGALPTFSAFTSSNQALPLGVDANRLQLGRLVHRSFQVKLAGMNLRKRQHDFAMPVYQGDRIARRTIPFLEVGKGNSQVEVSGQSSEMNNERIVPTDSESLPPL